MRHTDAILLTGGTGFFGRALLRHLLQLASDGEPVAQLTVLTRSVDAFAQAYPEFQGLAWLHWHQGDVCDAATLPHGQRFSYILHAATDSTRGPALTPLQRFDQIVQGTRNLLQLAQACGARRFLHTSSGAVYGPQPPELEQIPEERLSLPDPLNPANAYGLAKRTAEHLCALYGAVDGATEGLEVVNARCFAFVGQDLPLDVHFAIGNFVRDALYAEAITVQGDGLPLRSYMDQRDLAHWLLQLLYRGRSGQAYNVGSDRAISMAALAHLVRDLLAPAKPVHIRGRGAPAGVSAGARNRYIPSIAKARHELGLGLTVPLERAIQDMAAAQRHAATARP